MSRDAYSIAFPAAAPTVVVNGVELTVADAIARAEDIAALVRATEGALGVLETAVAVKRTRLVQLQDAQEPYLQALSAWRRARGEQRPHATEETRP